MKTRKCPKCKSENIATERRPNGNSKCIACHYEAPTKEFDVKNWDWIDQETQKQLDKLKSLMSVQLDMLEQNKQMSADIEQLKSENRKLVEINDRALSSAPFQEITQLKSKLKVAVDLINIMSCDRRIATTATGVHMVHLDDCRKCKALKEIGEV